MKITEWLDWERFKPGIPLHVWTGLLLGVMVALGLAAAYVFGGGIELLDNGQFMLIDSYAFTIAALIGGIGVGGSFYVYYRDVSSTLAVVSGMLWGLYFGLEDLMVYALLGRLPPESLAWLNDSLIGVVAGFIGFSSVSRLALLSVVLVTGLVLLVFVKTLVLLETRVFGIEV